MSSYGCLSVFFLRLSRYKTQGPADLTICYMTVFISEVLRLLATKKTRLEGEKKISELSMKANFAIPGESKFPLAGFFGQPASRSDAEQFRQYFRQLREETCMRLLDIVYNTDGEKPHTETILLLFFFIQKMVLQVQPTSGGSNSPSESS